MKSVKIKDVVAGEFLYTGTFTVTPISGVPFDVGGSITLDAGASQTPAEIAQACWEQAKEAAVLAIANAARLAPTVKSFASLKGRAVAQL